MNLTGLQFARAARFWRAAHNLLDASNVEEVWEPANYLLAMAIELTLKAYLSRSGTNKSKVRGIGHNLTKLLRLSIISNLGVSETQARLVLLAARSHDAHYFRYGPNTQQNSHVILLPEIKHLLTATAELIDISSGSPNVLRDEQPWTKSYSKWPLTVPPLRTLDLTQLHVLQKEIESESVKVDAINSRLSFPHKS